MTEIINLTAARSEAAKWGVTDRIRFIQTDGNFSKISDEKFDIIFTKSVLWSIKNLADFLDQIESMLAKGGKVAFVENVRGGNFLLWLRRYFVWRGRLDYGHEYYGITRAQIRLFEGKFDEVRATRHLGLVYTITGRKRPPV